MSRGAGEARTGWPWLLALWAAVAGAALWVRPLLPVDETRYATVAWEMWSRGDFLVPHLNAAPYAHKPPLLFWLIHLGWAAFGVNEWWPRLVVPLVSLLDLVLLALLARRLWPARPETAPLAVWLLFGTFVWLLFYTLLQFDLLLVGCTLFGLIALLDVAQGRGAAWGWFGLAIGLGVLAKGPVILLHLLPVALLGPFWAPPRRWPRWYMGLLGAVALGGAIALAWALPAGFAGGPEYRAEIFWGQTAGRVADSFAHARPFWWYLGILPLMLLPWLLWPRLWRAAAWERGEEGLRFLACWALPVFLLLSLVSGKQLKYLFPLLPAAALLAAYWLSLRPGPAARPWLAGLMLALGGLALLVLPFAAAGRAAPWLASVPPAWGMLALVLAAAFVIRPLSAPHGLVQATAAAAALLFLVAELSVIRAGAPAYDVSEAAARIRAWQAAELPVAHVGKYHGQFGFAGRLRVPLEVVSSKALPGWLCRHPQGRVVLYQAGWPELGPGAEYVQAYRGDPDDLALWRADRLAAVLGVRCPGGR